MSRYFKDDELRCEDDSCCGGTVAMDRHFMELLDVVRHIYGKPMFVTSGFRCNKHNKEVGGVKNSNHTKGRAVDVYVKDRDYTTLKDIAVQYFNEVIIYTDKNFIHIGRD